MVQLTTGKILLHGIDKESVVFTVPAWDPRQVYEYPLELVPPTILKTFAAADEHPFAVYGRVRFGRDGRISINQWGLNGPGLGTRAIFRDSGNGDYYVAYSEEEAVQMVVDKGVGRDEIELERIPAEQTVKMVMIDEVAVPKTLIPDGGEVILDWDSEGLVIEATAAQWLRHLPADVPSPWLVGEW